MERIESVAWKFDFNCWRILPARHRLAIVIIVVVFSMIPPSRLRPRLAVRGTQINLKYDSIQFHWEESVQNNMTHP
jgi:hypothetical protein